MLKIKEILKLLRSDDWYIGDEHIDIAKGLREAPRTYKEIKPFFKRNKFHM